MYEWSTTLWDKSTNTVCFKASGYSNTYQEALRDATESVKYSDEYGVVFVIERRNNHVKKMDGTESN